MSDREETLAGLYRLIEEHPAGADSGSPAPLVSLAAWYEESGDSASGACLRWAAEQARRPFRYRRDGEVKVSSAAWHDGWYWWALDVWDAGKDWGHPASCRLPRHLWDALAHTFDYDPVAFKEYPTQRAAWEALLAAWHKARETTGPSPVPDPLARPRAPTE